MPTRSFYVFLGLLALAGAGWLAYSVTRAPSGATVSAMPLEDLGDAQALLDAAQGVDGGSPDAPVHVMVFSDFTCPSCKHFNEVVEPRLQSELIATGKVRYTYHDYPLDPLAREGNSHRHGLLAARAARCVAEQGRFWEFHDLLFERQQQWSFDRRPPFERLEQYAAEVGAQVEPFRACLDGDAHTQVIMANRMLGDSLHITGTPTTYVEGRVLDPWDSYDALVALVEEALARR